MFEHTRFCAKYVEWWGVKLRGSGFLSGAHPTAMHLMPLCHCFGDHVCLKDYHKSLCCRWLKKMVVLLFNNHMIDSWSASDPHCKLFVMANLVLRVAHLACKSTTRAAD